MHNVVSADQMLGDVAKGIKEVEGDVGGEPFFGGIILGRDVEAVDLGRGGKVRTDLDDPDRVAGADVCDSEALGLGWDGRVQHVFEAMELELMLDDEAG